MNRSHLIMAAAVGIAVGAMALSSAQVTPEVNALRVQEKLTFSEDLNQNMPPDMLWAQAMLGTFRGIGVNYLFFRAEQLKQQGKYFEAMALADWITTLQPRFPQVWAFKSWNMAYNISVATTNSEERWMWVNKGVELLRAKGIPANPTSVLLYQELSWLFFHKIGDMLDDAHFYYKRQMAKEWHAVLGEPDRTDFVRWIGQIAGAPTTTSFLVSARPGTAEAVRALESAGYSLAGNPGDRDRRFELLKAISAEDSLSQSAKAEVIAAIGREKSASPIPPMAKADREALVAFLRRQVLVTDYNMDPNFMRDLTDEYGPLDWRHPISHALYWAELGVKVELEREGKVFNPETYRTLNTARRVLHSMQELYRKGLVLYDPVTETVDYSYEPAFAWKMFHAAKKVNLTFGPEDSKTFEPLLVNFYSEAAFFLWVGGKKEQARELQVYVQNEFILKRPIDKRNDPIMGSLDDYMVAQGKDILDVGPDQARSFVMTLIQTGLSAAVVRGNATEGEGLLKTAEGAFKQYKDNQANLKMSERTNLNWESMDDAVADALIPMMFTRLPDYVEGRDKAAWEAAAVSAYFQKSRYYNAVNTEVRKRVFDRLIVPLRDEPERVGLALKVSDDVLFPEPAGMREFRIAMKNSTRGQWAVMGVREGSEKK